MRYFKISEQDLIRLLRDSLTLREIQSVKPVSEDLAELELSKFHEVPEYIVPMPEKPFCFEGIIPGHLTKTSEVPGESE